MLAGLTGGRARVLRPDRVDQLHVALGGLRRLHIGAVERDRDPALDAERLPALLEDRVAGGLDNQPVEGDVVLRERVGVAAPGRIAHGLELDLERRDIATELLCREPRSELLQGSAHRVDLDHLLLVEYADARATERLRLDEP